MSPRRHGEAWWRFRSRVTKHVVAPEAARASVPELDAVTTDFVHRYVDNTPSLTDMIR